MRSILYPKRRLDFKGTSMKEDARSRTPTPVRKMTSEFQRLRMPKRRFDDLYIHEIDESIKSEVDDDIIVVDGPENKRQRDDSGIEDDDDIEVVYDNTLKSRPNKRCYSYASLFETSGGVNSALYGKFLRDFAKGQFEPARKPLGCTYDESTHEWFLADSANNAVRILRKDSTRGTAITLDLKYPSALVVTETGRYCAILDNFGIRLYDYRRESFFNLVEHDRRDGNFNCRGLGLTSNGDLVTIEQSTTMPQILFFSTKQPNHLIKSFPYTTANLQYQDPRPCFLDIVPSYGSQDRMAITDLGCGTFSLYDLDPKKCEVTSERRINCLGNADDHFQFISGVKYDSNGDLLIGDAQGHSLKYFSKDGKFIQQVKFNERFPYVSNFCVNSNNELLACDRQNGTIKLFQLTVKDQLDFFMDSLL